MKFHGDLIAQMKSRKRRFDATATPQDMEPRGPEMGSAGAEELSLGGEQALGGEVEGGKQALQELSLIHI